MKSRFYVAGLICGTLALAACSSSANTTDGSGTSSAGLENNATGPVIEVGVVSIDTGASVSPPQADGVEAYAKYINAHGGIAGRQLKVIRCDEKGDSAAHSACIRQFIADPSLVAAIPGAARFTGDVGIPAYTAADMPVIDPNPLYAPEFSAPTSVGINGGSSVAWGTMVSYLAKDKGAKKFVITGADSAGNAAQASTAKDWVTKLGGSLQDIFFPTTSTDLTPTATAISAAGADAILGTLAVNSSAPMLQALQQAGNDKPLAFLPQSLPPEVLKATGSAADGVISARFYPDPTTNDEKTLYAGYLDAVKALGRQPSDTSFSGFLAGEVFRRYVEAAGGAGVSRASLLDAIKNKTLTDVPFLPSQFGRSQSPDPATLAAIGNPVAYPSVVKDGKFQLTDGKSVNPFTTG